MAGPLGGCTGAGFSCTGVDGGGAGRGGPLGNSRELVRGGFELDGQPLGGRVELRACCFELYSEYSGAIVTRTASDDQQFGIFWSSKRGAVALSPRTSLPAHDEFLGGWQGSFGPGGVAPRASIWRLRDYHMLHRLLVDGLVPNRLGGERGDESGRRDKRDQPGGSERR